MDDKPHDLQADTGGQLSALLVHPDGRREPVELPAEDDALTAALGKLIPGFLRPVDCADGVHVAWTWDPVAAAELGALTPPPNLAASQLAGVSGLLFGAVVFMRQLRDAEGMPAGLADVDLVTLGG